MKDFRPRSHARPRPSFVNYIPLAIFNSMNQDRYCFLDGKIIKEKDASLPLSDIGILRAYAVYDGIAGFKGKPFLFKNHYERFVRSATALGINIPYSVEELYQALCEILEKSKLMERVSIRAIATGGETIAGIDFAPENSTIFFTALPFSPLPSEFFKEGAKLVSVEYQREFPEYKTVNYITGVKEQKKRKEAGAVEILYVSKGKILECATSNIFIVKNGVCITPNKGVLGGITRKLIISFLEEDGYLYEERDVVLEELMDADEVFITSSFKDIVPIIYLDEQTVGHGVVGPKTMYLMERFKDYIASGKGLALETRV